MWMSHKVRAKFLDFFRDRNHLYVHSSSVLPNKDEGSYFINAGMNQFKPIIMGTVDQNSEMANYRRVVNSQKCIRVGGKHNDLHDVGRDTYHHTFFEMLGSWSFGDYFKDIACEMAWELMTRVYGLSTDRLYVTYFAGSDVLGLKPDWECKDIWKRIGVSESHIFARGMSDNFWDMGDTGPCGPCTEIHYDYSGCGPQNIQSASLLELWNLVFMQFDRQADGSLKVLPCHHVDTGMGLERITAVLQGCISNYDTDLFQPLFNVLLEKGKCPHYSSEGARNDVMNASFRIVADHARMFTVAISDGLLPGRGESQSKLKGIINRSVRQSRDILKVPQGTVGSLVPVVVDILGDAFPELQQNCAYVQSVVNETEHRYLSLIEGSEEIMKKALLKYELKPGDAMTPEQVYQLCDGRFGRQVPFDILSDILQASDISCDTSYDDYIKQQKLNIQPLDDQHFHKDSRNLLDQHDLNWLKSHQVPTTNVSAVFQYAKKEDKYVFSAQKAIVLAIKEDGSFVEEVKFTNEQEVIVILDRTCFYAEKGGQVGDTGYISSIDGAVFQVEDTQVTQDYVQHVGTLHNGTLRVGSQVNSAINHVGDTGYISSIDGAVFQVEDTQVTQDYVQHLGTLHNGTLRVGSQVNSAINHAERESCMLNHSGTHIIHHCLNRTCGGARQQGSLVTPSSLHFEFSLNQSEISAMHIIEEVTTLANKIIEECQPLYVEEMDFEEAKKIEGLSFLTSAEYSKDVRVVSFGTPAEDVAKHPGVYSVELCGGTHVMNTGDMGALCVISFEGEEQFSKRLVAVTGERAKEVIQEGKNLKDRVYHLKENMHKNIERDTLISQRKEIGKLLGVAVISKTDRYLVNQELSKLDRQLMKAAVGRARFRQEITEVLEQTPTNKPIVQLVSAAKPRDVVKVLTDLKLHIPVVILFESAGQKSVLSAVCSVPKIQIGVTAESLAMEVCKHTGGSMKVPNKAHMGQFNDVYVVRWRCKTTVDKEATHIKKIIQNFLASR